MCIAQIEKGDTVEIKKVDRGTELADKLLRFVEEFSWEDVKAHMLDELRAWTFTDWETPFVAIINGRIIGIAYIRKSDYYPLPEIYPWVSGIFVTESYRGHRISEKLISFANEYAKEKGFDKTYIPSVHTGLYEKYGYRIILSACGYGRSCHFFFLGAGRSSYIALNRPFRNSLLSTSSTNSISFAPS